MKNQSKPAAWGTQQLPTDPISKTTALSSRLSLESSSKRKKRGEGLKSKAGGTLAIRAMREQHANLIKNKSRNVSEFVIILI